VKPQNLPVAVFRAVLAALSDQGTSLDSPDFHDQFRATALLFGWMHVDQSTPSGWVRMEKVKP
jgi:hypothetical protein